MDNKQTANNKRIVFAMLTYILCPVVVLVLFQNCGSQEFHSAKSLASLGTGDLITPTDPTKPPPEEPAYKTHIQVNQMMANRVLMVNYFKSIFGDDIAATANAYISRQVGDFGSAYTIYDRVVTSDCATKKNPLTTCTANESMVIEALPNIGVNIRREAWRIRTCHVATKYRTLDALKKIDSKATSAKPPALNDANLKKAFHLFYRARKAPSIQVIDALAIAGQQQSKPIDQWKEVLLTICLSPHWQVL